MTARTVTIHYRRPPDRVELFVQPVVAVLEDCTVTFIESASRDRPSLIDGETILEPGSPIVWFTYPDRWHDIGRFHRKDGTFTGLYANVLTPVRTEGDRWETTDLCLDVWMGREGRVEILDEHELLEAESRGWIDEETIVRARQEAASIAAAAVRGDWPPPEVLEWTLERVRRELSR